MQEARNKKSVFLLSVLCLLAVPLHASMVLPVQLDQLAKRADIVFRGVCREKREEKFIQAKTGKAIPVLVYTFKTEDVIKGNVGSVMEVKQWGIKTSQEAFQFGLIHAAATSFNVGKEYLLFLSVPSKNGIHSVIGGTQGVFEVTKDAQGKAFVANAFGNRNLFRSLPQKNLSKSEQTVVQAPPGPVPYDDFASLVKKALNQ